MRTRTHLGWIAIAGAWAAWSVLPANAQSAPANDPAPCTVAPQPEPCGTKPADAKSAHEKFPFPGEAAGQGASSSTPAAPAPSEPAPLGLNGVPEAPDTPPATSAPAAKQEFPFPGEPAQPEANSAANSSSSSSSGDDATPVDPGAAAGSTPGLKDKGSEGSTANPGRHILHRVNPVGTKLQSADEREAEDLDIAHYYTQTGDLQGAYLRSQDAVKTAPDDPEAHFTLAEAALKLKKRDEAIAEFNACLKLDPVDKQAKAARKALAALKP